MDLPEATRERITSLIATQDVVLFMKGNREAPQCGFSATVVRLLDSLVPDYGTVDVLADPEIRNGIKEFSAWPTVPQLYVRGEFVGGCDIVQELYANGELHSSLGVEVGELRTPRVTVSDAAAEALGRVASDAEADRVLHLEIDARFSASLTLSPPAPGGSDVQANGVSLRMSALTAQRADGLTIDVVETPQGPAFRIDNPNAPKRVSEMTASELKRRLDAAERFEFVDVRSPEEREIASLPGTTLLTPDEARRLESLPRNAMLVFHCHHGGRSQAAAEHFAALGFTNVWNVAGGIDAWSQDVDSAVPRY